jgi:hypothetical protein
MTSTSLIELGRVTKNVEKSFEADSIVMVKDVKRC